MLFKMDQQSVHRRKTLMRGEPLRLRKRSIPGRVARTLLQQHGHGVAVGGEVIQQRRDAERSGELFEISLVPGKRVAVDEDIKPGVLALHHDVETRTHVSVGRKTPPGDRRFSSFL